MMRRSDNKLAVQFGAGNIGRGLMGQFFWEAGFETIFVDTNAVLVGHLNEQGSYPLRLLDAYTRTPQEFTIDRFQAFSTEESATVAEMIAQAEMVATAVGVANLDAVGPLLAEGIRARLERAAGPLDVYLCENMLGAASKLSENVGSLLDGPVRGWAEENVGFVGMSVARIVGGTGTRSPQDDPLLVVADAHRSIPYDRRAVRADRPDIDALHPVRNFQAEVERKIFTHNIGHASLAYLGYLRGFTYVHEAIDDDGVRSIFDGALDETTAALLHRYRADLDRREHMRIRQDVRIRFGNPLLRDGIARVARDPIRKLGRNDRIAGAAELCISCGVVPEHIAIVCAAALCFDCPDDPQATRLQNTIQQHGQQETLRRLSGIEPASEFGRRVSEHYDRLQSDRTR